ncbi:diguanylate cyclase (GGDEF)-like protein/putative nucleotidyltransferase with HDIG domain/PAS domain S-box-containing protein [Clostridium beijerinckii]|uniref:Diguanylate cyclase (GGDEF)-like protein/putative nucleotidyltransferase with HDIG domain/PAS domain S-box-containing protein n=2 Tax=Clostridium beijerinckii TaxID=1520 RepID=A0AAX0B8V1_CLOBE|nr:diguanylate cyclase (GGDEF)-like protein/putative nucleotidyltransferase with HDIG domain/PAS domain S-box-containing protein [Clostridium beijerinckii]NYC71111.1 diguanylate cyclase (GGDEF)-like protein/putative nucleotidyltransferase with HDIG domain/PAS domain S-box-containing protein [Clostridium beijerinckii]
MLIKEKGLSRLSKNKYSFKYENIKICLIYAVIGLIWIFVSDAIIDLITNVQDSALKISIYKGVLFIMVTTSILYVLINKFLKKICNTEQQLRNSYKDLGIYVKQLSDYEDELKIQYEQIRKDEIQIKEIEEKSRAIIKAIPDILFTFDCNGVFIDTEAKDENILMLPKEEFIGKTISEVMPKEIAGLAYENLKLVLETGKLHTFEYKLLGSYCEIRMVKCGADHVLAALRDMTVKKELEERLEYLCYNDQLTGLYNRRYYEEELKSLDVKENYPLTIVLGDVNGLKLINDSFGHVVGDELIKKSAQIIKNGCRSQDVVIRLGGDEFVILLPQTDTYEAEKIVENINNLAKKEKIQGLDIYISFGYETKCHEDEMIQEIFIKAEDYMYKRKLFESSNMRGKTIDTIINTLNEKNKREEQHSVRVAELCELMGKNIGLPKRKIQELKNAGLLHDIGKIAIEENILNKPGRLTEDEYNEIKRHPEIGYRILSTVNEMSEIAKYVLSHHEMWNGEGYPKGIKDIDIPFESRIISIVDAYDAMTSERPYRKALSEEFAIEELKRNSGIQFDPELVNLFIEKVLNK